MDSGASNPRIAYVFQDQYPWDIRVDKITSSLADAGFPTVIVSRNRSGLPVDEMLRTRLDVRRLPRQGPAILRTLLNFPAFFSPIWIWTIFSVVKSRSLDLVIIRDLPLAPAAWLAGRMAGVPVIMDMAENYPAMIKDTWDHRGPISFDFLLRNPALLRRLEKWILPRLDGVMVVSKASQARVQKLIGEDREHVWVVQNTPRLEAVNEARESDLSQRMRRLPGLKLLYVGGLEECRGLMIAIEAMPSVLNRVGLATFVIVGEGSSRSALERKISKLGLEDNIIFAGWLDQEFVPGVIAAADICLVPHLVTEHIDTTVPNKIYDYMAQSKPVLVTHSRSLREIVESNECGLSYEDKEPASLARAISQS